ncbi:flavin reductase family protein [Variovorax sp. GB1P17]|uniref:flavin reductase family protein n=1 Tax=Variovorax sp. GB1P17 TaxID=3443740 RepID=UPI003F4746C3
MLTLDPERLTQVEIYKLMTGIVVPRPIAWVTTLSETGVVNAAPFSSFTFVSHDPPMLAIGIDAKPGGAGLKDTARNILHRREFVVHIADHSLLQALHDSSGDYPSDVGELELLGLEMRLSARVSTPCIAHAPIAAECVLEQSVVLGRQPTRLMIGRVVQFHVRDSLIANGRIDAVALNPVCRLGGPHYAGLGTVTSLPPPLLRF